jgi:hypothetical protein
MTDTAELATERVDQLLQDKKNRDALSQAFADWLALRAAAPAEEAQILSSPLAAEDAENGLTVTGLAEYVRIEAAHRSPWCDGEQCEPTAVDRALLRWAQTVLVGLSNVPAWSRRPNFQ